MKAELKKEWIRRLRSGAYQQGTGYLRDNSTGEEEYCCMGVLCDIVDPKSWDKNDAGQWNWRQSYELLNRDELDEVHLPIDDQDELMAMNDSAWSEYQQKTLDSHDFDEIADWIDSHVEETVQ